MGPPRSSPSGFSQMMPLAPASTAAMVMGGWVAFQVQMLTMSGRRSSSIFSQSEYRRVTPYFSPKAFSDSGLMSAAPRNSMRSLGW